MLFSYDAEDDDELTLVEGMTITILEKDLEDSGWWKGETNGKVGVFPGNFVQLLPQEEVGIGPGVFLNVYEVYVSLRI